MLAGYSLGEADLLRRAMGKKIQSEMDAQRARFVEGCGRNDIPPAKAEELFDLIDKFAGYGFNKSHAAGYALIAYHTAWLKVHHRAEFYAASMSFDISLTDKLALFVDDMRRGEVECLDPDINASSARFTVEDGKVRMAWTLKGVGRKRGGLGAGASAVGLHGIEDFAARIDPGILNRRQLESLAGAGAFDSLEPDRAALFAGAETILAHAASAQDQRVSGQAALFGANPEAIAPIRLKRDAPWTLAQRMAAEREAFGFYFSSHPIDAQRHLLAAHQVRRYASLAEMRIAEGERAGASMAGLVEDVRWRTSARGGEHDGDAERSGRTVRGHRVRGRRLRRARGRGQVRPVRTTDGRARQKARRRHAASHGQALPAARRAGEEDPAPAHHSARQSCLDRAGRGGVKQTPRG